MNESIEALKSALKNEITIGEKFLALLDRKKDSIIKNDIELMDQLNKEENDTIQEIEELGYHRQEMVLNISNGPDFRVTENLKDFIPQLAEDDQSILAEMRYALLKNYEKITNASKLNAELLAQSIGVTQHLFKRLSSVDHKVKSGGNYQKFQTYKKKVHTSPVFKHQG